MPFKGNLSTGVVLTIMLAWALAMAAASPAANAGPVAVEQTDNAVEAERVTAEREPLQLRLLHASGQQTVDSAGKIVVLHGANAVHKRPPYYPDATKLSPTDVSNIAGLGFNSVRLGIIWKGLEPCKVGSQGCPGYDEGYLDRIQEIANQLEAAGVYVLLDFHQDLYSDTRGLRCLWFFTCDFHGEGAPDWATNNDNLWIGPPIGGAYWGAEYVLYPGISAAFDHLINPANEWNDIQAHYRAAWRHVAERFADDPGVLGYDLINEPWPETILPIAARMFDRYKLHPFSQSLIDAIRTVDRDHTIYYEPNPLNNAGPPYTMPSEFNPQDSQRNLALSYHIYCLMPGLDIICDGGEAATIDTKKREIRERGIAGYVTEFGANNDYDETGYIMDLADTRAQGWNYWQWEYWDDPYGGVGGGEHIANPDGTLNQDKAQQLARTYPRSIAADDPGSTGREPRWCFTRPIFDPQSSPPSLCSNQTEGHFSLTYNADRRYGVTTVFVPVEAPLDDQHKTYPNGYRITYLKGATVISLPNAPLLRIRNRTSRMVRLELEPR